MVDFSLWFYYDTVLIPDSYLSVISYRDNC